MKIIENIKDWHLTKRTGLTKPQRDYQQWYLDTVNLKAKYIRDMFKNFEYCVEITNHEFFNLHEPFALIPCKEASPYFSINRPSNDRAVWRIERVVRDEHGWCINDLSNQEVVFVATNNYRDAVTMMLRWG
jgi:hypothetical protein